MSKLVIVGTVAFDAIETPFGQTDKILGGAATFIGMAASLYDVDSAIVSVVGGDFPQEYIDKFHSLDIDVSSMEVVPDGKTFFWSGKYHYDMNSRDTLATELNVLADFQPVVPDNFKDAEIVMLGNLHPLVQLSVIDQLKNPSLVLLDTMNYWMDTSWDDLMKVIKRVDMLVINDEEARQLSGEYSLVMAAQKIHEMGPKFIVIKKGEHGALLFRDNQIFYAPALPLKSVFDPTGAGDTFAGGVSGYLAKTMDFSFENMKNAVINGSALASFSVEKFGTQRLEEVSQQELNDRLLQFEKLTQFNIRLA
jgi:sugar/nucleoside kinase (ribokinase family)